MAHALTLAIAPIRTLPLGALRAPLVIGCALALIFAGQALPF
jgi:hypothetical protein